MNADPVSQTLLPALMAGVIPLGELLASHLVLSLMTQPVWLRSSSAVSSFS